MNAFLSRDHQTRQRKQAISAWESRDDAKATGTLGLFVVVLVAAILGALFVVTR